MADIRQSFLLQVKKAVPQLYRKNVSTPLHIQPTSRYVTAHDKYYQAFLRVSTAGAAARIYNWGGKNVITRCRRQCTEAHKVDQSARSAEMFFRLHFSAIRMGSRGTFVLLHCKFQMYEDCRSWGRHVPQISLTNVIRTYVHGYTRVQF